MAHELDGPAGRRLGKDLALLGDTLAGFNRLWLTVTYRSDHAKATAGAESAEQFDGFL